MTVTVATVL